MRSARAGQRAARRPPRFARAGARSDGRGRQFVVSHLVPHDVHHAASRAWLTRQVADGEIVVAPALLVPEIAGAVARRTAMPRLAARAVEAVLRIPGLRLVPVDDGLARAAATLAGRLGLRGADAVYIAVAEALRLPLVTWDVEQRERGARIIEVRKPEGAG